MHELVVSPFLGGHLVLRPGRRNAVKISPGLYAEPGNIAEQFRGDVDHDTIGNQVKSWG